MCEYHDDDNNVHYAHLLRGIPQDTDYKHERIMRESECDMSPIKIPLPAPLPERGLKHTSNMCACMQEYTV